MKKVPDDFGIGNTEYTNEVSSIDCLNLAPFSKIGNRILMSFLRIAFLFFKNSL